jgi:poly(3-hydroxybutyrate) depolymerase
MEEKFSIDTSRVFTTGISAGGTMSAALMASYPEKIKAGALVSAVSYGCSFSLLNSYTCMFAPASERAQTRGDYVRDANGNFKGNYPQVMIVHGANDKIVSFTNSTHSVEQWLNVHGLDDTVDTIEPIPGNLNVESYQDARSNALVEKILIDDGAHGWPINPSAGCGNSGQFYVSGELCLTDILAKRWGLE